MTVWDHKLPEFYYAWAPDYARQVENELDYKPKGSWAAASICSDYQCWADLWYGCGTGHICVPNGS